MEEEKKDTQLAILQEPMALGEVFARSGLFPDAKTQFAAAVKILAGRELGLSPFESMGGIYMVNGRLSLMANVMALLLKRSKKYDFSIKKLDETECSIAILQKENGSAGVEIGISTFTFKDAAKAGLANKDVWKSYPRNLLFARALSNGIRWYAPDALCGYSAAEEMEDIVIEPTKTTVEITNDGEVINGQT